MDGVSYLVTLVFQLFSLCPPRPYLPPSLPSPRSSLPVPPYCTSAASRHQCPCLTRDVPTPTLTFIDTRCRVPAGVRAYLERTFELCERIRGTRLCLKLSIPVYSHWSLNILETYTDPPPNLSYSTLCYHQIGQVIFICRRVLH